MTAHSASEQIANSNKLNVRDVAGNDLGVKDLAHGEEVQLIVSYVVDVEFDFEGS